MLSIGSAHWVFKRLSKNFCHCRPPTQCLLQGGFSLTQVTQVEAMISSTGIFSFS